MSKKIDKLETKNKRILDFYNKYDLDFETMNLSIIDMLENIMNRMNGTINDKIIKDIMNNINEMKNDYNEKLKDIENEVKINMIKKIYDIREDIKNINRTEIIDLIKKDIDNVLKNINNDNINKLKEILDKNYKDIKNDIKDDKLTLSIKNDIELKFNNVLLQLERTLTGNNNNIVKNILEIKENNIRQNENQIKINNELEKYLNKYNNSSLKGQIGEIKLNDLLNKLYPTAEIYNSSQESNSGDVIIKRDGYNNILIDNKEYNKNVPKDEVNKFIRDIDNIDCDGILISQLSGISNKENYQIDVHNNKILLYIHNCNYDLDKINIGIKMIDHLKNRIKELSKDDYNVYKITNDELLNINQEYNNFINQRDMLKNTINDFNKKIVNQLNDLNLPNLNNILSLKFSNSSKLKCEKCGFLGKNNKSYAAHKKACDKKIISKRNSDTNSSETISET
jgi:hypothetical protein